MEPIFAPGSKDWARTLVEEYERGRKHRVRAQMAYRMAYQALNKQMPYADGSGYQPEPEEAQATAVSIPLPKSPPVVDPWWDDERT